MYTLLDRMFHMSVGMLARVIMLYGGGFPGVLSALAVNVRTVPGDNCFACSQPSVNVAAGQ